MAAVAWTTIFKQRRRALPRDPMPEHPALHTAIVAGDAEAAREAMVVLIDLALAATEISILEAEHPITMNLRKPPPSLLYTLPLHLSASHLTPPFFPPPLLPLFPT